MNAFCRFMLEQSQSAPRSSTAGADAGAAPTPAAPAPSISWRGVPIEDLDREALIEALRNSYRRITQLRDERDALDIKLMQIRTRIEQL